MGGLGGGGIHLLLVLILITMMVLLIVFVVVVVVLIIILLVVVLRSRSVDLSLSLSVCVCMLSNRPSLLSLYGINQIKSNQSVAVWFVVVTSSVELSLHQKNELSEFSNHAHRTTVPSKNVVV